MLFHSFGCKAERLTFGGSYFIEIQYCRVHAGVSLAERLNACHYWMDDSLYVYGDDDNRFFQAYAEIFAHGIYGSGRIGVMDLCGFNYYSPEETTRILEALRGKTLPEQDTLVQWLEKARESGFYILGL